MLKFIKGHMSSISDISIYPIIGFVLFFGIFIIATWLIMTTSRNRLKHLEELPFTDNEKTGHFPQSTARQ
jgi:cytochrome c oxidase cbb3-type subunit IV